jgi:hypothetical protein
LAIVFPKKKAFVKFTMGNFTKLRGTKKLEKPKVVNSFVIFVTIKGPNKQGSNLQCGGLKSFSIIDKKKWRILQLLS